MSTAQISEWPPLPSLRGNNTRSTWLGYALGNSGGSGRRS